MNKQPIAIPKEHKLNLEQIVHAAKHGMLGVLSTYEKSTGKPAFLLIAKNENDDGSFEIVPFGRLWGANENPIDLYEDPLECECNRNADNDIEIQE